MWMVSTDDLRRQISDTLDAMGDQGHDVETAKAAAADLPDSYDAMIAFAEGLADLPMRESWPHVEPVTWEDTVAELDPDRAVEPMVTLGDDEAAARIREGFLGSVCGCELGKPVEINASMAFLRDAFESVGEWPINDYISLRSVDACGGRNDQAFETCRETITYAAPDDDINYSILGMLNLEQHGKDFTFRQLIDLWRRQLSPGWTFGPERLILLREGAASMGFGCNDAEAWAGYLNPRNEWCGAMIRADAYGFACVGDPATAAELAFRDASLTHRKTGVYGTMFAAASIAAAACTDDPLEVFEIASDYVPQRSRFYKVVRKSLDVVSATRDFQAAYDQINQLYGEFGHCRIFMETGTMINALAFAENVGDGICKQVMQGNDTDSYGCTIGSILGVFFGGGHLEPRWLAPFQDTLRTSLANFHETRLSAVADRMARLPQLLAEGS